MGFELLAVAPDQVTAEIWIDILKQAGIMAIIEPRDAVSFLGVSALPCRVLVPGESLDEARTLLPVDLDDGPSPELWDNQSDSND